MRINQSALAFICALASMLMAPAVRAQAIQQGDTSHPITFTLVSDGTSGTPHISPVTGATPIVTISKNGGAYGAIAVSATVAEVANGLYKFTPAPTDVNTFGALDLHITASGADPLDLHTAVVAYNPYDANVLGLTGIATSAAQTTNTLTIVAIKAKTDTIGTNAGDSPNTVTLQGHVTGTVMLASSYTAPPTDYARNNAAPSWWAAPIDPWATALPGSYGTGTAGNIVAGIKTTLGTPAGASVSADIAGIPAATAAALGAQTFITIDAAHSSDGVSFTLTKHQFDALCAAVLAGDSATPTAPVASGTATIKYYLVGNTVGTGTLVATGTVSFDANKVQTGRTYKVQHAFPSIP